MSILNPDPSGANSRPTKWQRKLPRGLRVNDRQTGTVIAMANTDAVLAFQKPLIAVVFTHGSTL